MPRGRWNRHRARTMTQPIKNPLALGTRQRECFFRSTEKWVRTHAGFKNARTCALLLNLTSNQPDPVQPPNLGKQTAQLHTSWDSNAKLRTQFTAAKSDACEHVNFHAHKWTRSEAKFQMFFSNRVVARMQLHVNWPSYTHSSCFFAWFAWRSQ